MRCFVSIMSRVANDPVKLPSGVEFSRAGDTVTIKGGKGQMQHRLHVLVDVVQEADGLKMTAKGDSKVARTVAGTTRALLQNMVTGVVAGHERKLMINGVGYRAEVKGKALELFLGFSHSVKYTIPDNITITMPSQTEIVVRGTNKQQVGQVAAKIRSFRPPEPYKGKGVRYKDERLLRKEAKKV